MEREIWILSYREVNQLKPAPFILVSLDFFSIGHKHVITKDVNTVLVKEYATTD